MISDAAELNPTLKPSEIIQGNGVKAVSGAIDKGSTHLGKFANVVKKCRLQAMACEKWDIRNFERGADEIDKKDEQLKKSYHIPPRCGGILCTVHSTGNTVHHELFCNSCL